MMRINALLIIMAAMGCGMLAATAVSQLERLPHEQTVVAGEVQLFVAGVEVPAGELLTPQLVRLERWPRDRVPDGAVTRLEEFHRQVTRQALLPGQPLRRNLLRDAADFPGHSGSVADLEGVADLELESVANLENLDRSPSRGEVNASSIRAEPPVGGERRTPDLSQVGQTADAGRSEKSISQSFPITKPLVVRISMSVHPHEEESAEEDTRVRDSQNVLLVPTPE